MDNYITYILTVAYEFFNDKMQLLFELLMLDPQTFMNGTLWEIVEKVFDGLLASGYSVMSILLYIELIHSGYETIVQRKWEGFVWVFLMSSVMGGILISSKELLIMIYKIGQSFVSKILASSGYSVSEFSWAVPNAVKNATNGLSGLAGAIIFVLCFIGAVVVVFTSYKILLTGFGRIFNVYLHIAFAPIAFSFLASTHTRPFFMSYLKSFLVVTLQGAAIVGACVMFIAFSKGYSFDSTLSGVEDTFENGFVSEENNVPDWVIVDVDNADEDSRAVIITTSYLVQQAFLFLLLTGAIMGSDALVNRLTGIG